MYKLKEGKGLISVIIPCYNHGKYIEEAVDSILNQTYQNFEIIIINDGSTDEFTNNLLEHYDKPKTTVYHTENRGLANARNYGFEKSNGEFVQFLDSDDYILKDKFQLQIDIFEANKDIDIVYSDFKFYLQNEKKLKEKDIDVEIPGDAFEGFLYKWQREFSIPIHTAIFRRRAFPDKLPFIENFDAVEDWLMWVSLAAEGRMFFYLDKVLAVYRIQGGNMTDKKLFMLYWVSRAISYIVDHHINESSLERYNLESQKYLEFLLNIYFLEVLEGKVDVLSDENKNLLKDLSGLEEENKYWKEYVNDYNQIKSRMEFLSWENQSIKNRLLFRIIDKLSNTYRKIKNSIINH